MLERTDSATNNELPDKLMSGHLLALFPKFGYEAIYSNAQISSPNAAIPLYFKREKIILFPPSTDNPINSKFGLHSIEDNVNRAFSQNMTPLFDQDFLLFPVLEEWNSYIRLIPLFPRQMWVLLVYAKKDKQFYLLDPTGPNRAKGYIPQLKYIQNSLKIFNDLCQGPVRFTPRYLNVQPWSDNLSSGHWVAYFVTQFAPNKLLKNIEKIIATLEINAVKRYLADVSALAENQIEVITKASPSPHVTNTPYDLTFEKQDYGNPPNSGDSSTVHSLLTTTTTDPRFQATAENANHSTLPISGYGFRFDVYSILIFSGTTIAILALLSLASTASMLSVPVATGVLVTGIAMFVGGTLGKYGFFGGITPPSNAPPGASVEYQPGV